jgi:octaprenyl-diphosphate synthase
LSAADARLLRLLGPVEADMQQMRDILSAQVADASGAVTDMTQHLSRFRGKQLRGALVLLTGRACGRASEEHPAVAAIIEMIHLATLVHDDVLDAATVRRRVACVHQRWDNQVAVLLGDFLYARAFGLSTDLASRLCSRVLSETTRQLCAGEIDQSAQRYHFELSQERYEAIAGAKTAGLYAAACELGARYPDGDEALGSELRAFGWEIGLAFQIVDDCLDLMGDPEVVGKSVGTDVADGKVTLPVLYVHRNADHTTRARIRDAYTLPGLEDRLGRLNEVCELEPGIEYAMARAEELVGRAMRRLGSLPLSPSRAALEELGGFVLQRRW